MKPAVEKVAILGVGLVGASLGAAIRRSGFAVHVRGVGRSRSNLNVALERGCVDEIGHDAGKAVADADLVVLATPVDAFASLLSVVAETAPREALVTDVGSVKRSVCAAAAAVGLGSRFLGGHPMAGGVTSGAEYANADLFEGRVVALTPTVDTCERARNVVTSMWRRVRAEVLELDAAEHDHVVAASSHLPQMIAVVLAAAAAKYDRPELFARLAAAGFASVTRTAASDPAMWKAIVAANGDEIVGAMESFAGIWNQLREAILHDDFDLVRSMMQEAADFKRDEKK